MTDNRNRDRVQVTTQFLPDIPLEGSYALQNLLADMKGRLEELWQSPDRPAQPTGVTVTANNLGNNISWNIAVGAAAYQAFRNTTGDITTATLLRELPGNENVSFFDPNDQTSALRYYWIRGVNAKGDAGAFSTMVSGSNFLTDITGTAMGVDAQASATASTALGRNATASATNATAMGVSSLADAADATALGKSADAGGTDSVACGQAANASGANSAAMGANTTASATGATVVGEGSTVSGGNSVGVGQGLSITVASSVIVGQGATVSGATSVIVGQGSSSTQANTVGVGQGVTITMPGAIAIGQGASVTGAGFSNSIGIGKGVSIANFSNAIVIGTATTPASDTVAIGYGINNGYGVTIGKSASNNNSSSVAIGPNASVAAANAVAIGSGTTMSATGGNGVVIGTGSTCADTECVIVGYNSTVSSGNDSCILIGASNSNGNVNEILLIGKSLTATAANQAQIGSAITNYWFGRGVTHTGAAQNTLFHATDGTGTDISGDNFIVAAGAPTGAGTGGYIDLQTAPGGATGTDLRTLVSRIRITSTGSVGIGTTGPTEVLEVAGTVYSTSGGFKFPDGTTQASAGIAPGADPGADRIIFWDDSEGEYAYLETGNSLAITATSVDTIQDIRTTATPQFAQLSLGGVIGTYQFYQTGTFAGNTINRVDTTLNVTANAIGVGFNYVPTFVEASSGTHANMIGFQLSLAITAGSAALSSAVGFQVNSITAPASTPVAYGIVVSQPTGATVNHAIHVATGTVNIETGGSTSISSGTGTVKMTSVNNANNAVWIPFKYAGTTYYVPGWTTHAP